MSYYRKYSSQKCFQQKEKNAQWLLHYTDIFLHHATIDKILHICKHPMTNKRIFFTLCEKPDYIFSSASGNAGQKYFAVPLIS